MLGLISGIIFQLFHIAVAAVTSLFFPSVMELSYRGDLSWFAHVMNMRVGFVIIDWVYDVYHFCHDVSQPF